MNWVRKTLAYLLAVALVVVLLVGVLSFNLNSHFSKPDNLKTWLEQSHIYDHFVSNLVAQSQVSLGGNGQSIPISLTDATIQQAANRAFPPQLLQDSTNQFLDANYAWLQHKTSQPQYSLNLGQAKQAFASQVGQYVQGRFASLPICSATQLAQMQKLDPLTMSCRPADISAANEGAVITRQLANSSDFLPDPVLTASNLQSRIAPGSQPYYQRLSFAPAVYRWSAILPGIMAILAALLMIAILFLLPRRKGMRKIAGALLLAGLLLVATSFATGYVSQKLQSRLFNNSSVGPLQQSLTAAIHSAQVALGQTDLYFGVAFIVVAVAILIFLLTKYGRPAKPVSSPISAAAEQSILPVSTPVNNLTDSSNSQSGGIPPLPGKRPSNKRKSSHLIQ